MSSRLIPSSLTIQATLGNLVNELSAASITGGTNSSLIEQNHNRVKVSMAQEVSRVFYCFHQSIMRKDVFPPLLGGHEEKFGVVSCCLRTWLELYQTLSCVRVARCSEAWLCSDKTANVLRGATNAFQIHARLNSHEV